MFDKFSNVGKPLTLALGTAIAPNAAWKRCSSTREPGNRLENCSNARRGAASTSAFPARSNSKPAAIVSTPRNSASTRGSGH